MLTEVMVFMITELYHKAINRAVGWINDKRGEVHLYYALRLGELIGIPDKETMKQYKHEIDKIKDNMAIR